MTGTMRTYESCGLILTRKRPTGESEFLCVCRRDSIAFLRFIQGRYLPEELDTLWANMAEDEQDRIRTRPLPELFAQTRQQPMYWAAADAQYRKNQRKIQALCDASHIARWETPEWGFPKGRRHATESPLACALRECWEETSIPMSKLQILPIAPVEESHVGSDGICYRNRYYIARFTEPFELPDGIFENHPEIRRAMWCNMEEARALMQRPCEEPKLKLLHQIDAQLRMNTSEQ